MSLQLYFLSCSFVFSSHTQAHYFYVHVFIQLCYLFPGIRIRSCKQKVTLYKLSLYMRSSFAPSFFFFFFKHAITSVEITVAFLHDCLIKFVKLLLSKATDRLRLYVHGHFLRFKTFSVMLMSACFSGDSTHGVRCRTASLQCFCASSRVCCRPSLFRTAS